MMKKITAPEGFMYGYRQSKEWDAHRKLDIL